MARVRWQDGGARCAAYLEGGTLCRAPAAWYDDGPGAVLCEAHARESGIRPLAEGRELCPFCYRPASEATPDVRAIAGRDYTPRLTFEV